MIYSVGVVTLISEVGEFVPKSGGAILLQDNMLVTVGSLYSVHACPAIPAIPLYIANPIVHASGVSA